MKQVAEEKQTVGQMRAGYFESKLAEKGWGIVPGSEGKPEDSYPFPLYDDEGRRVLRETRRISNGEENMRRIDLRGNVFYDFGNVCIVLTENGLVECVRYPAESVPTNGETAVLKTAEDMRLLPNEVFSGG